MSTTTVRIKASQIYKDWHVIDAAGRPLGRVASQAAALLRGKHKPTFEPHLDDGDFVIVVNAAKVTLSGNKGDQIRYYRHSGYPGGLKSRTFTEQMDRSPARIIEQAVWGMLPKGPLGRKMVRHLKVYAGPEHPHESQIVGSERARAAREAALAEAAAAPPKIRRLRPLAGVVAPVEEPSEAAPAKTRRPSRRAARPAQEEPLAEAPVEAAAEPAPEAPEAAAPAAEEERPKRTRRPRAAASEPATAEAPAAEEAPTAAEEPKPRRTRARKAAADGEPEGEEKPKRTRARKAESTDTGNAEEAPKPRRSRTRKTESEGEGS